MTRIPLSRIALAALSLSLAAGTALADPRVRAYEPVDRFETGNLDHALAPFDLEDDELFAFEHDEVTARAAPAFHDRDARRARPVPAHPDRRSPAVHRAHPRPAPMRDGWVVTRHPNGQKAFEGLFRHGRPQGWVVRWFPNGQKAFEGAYADGVQHGWMTAWYPNGQKRVSGHFVNGVRHGYWTAWFRNGVKRSEGQFRDGRPDGWFTTWHLNGRKASQELRRG